MYNTSYDYYSINSYCYNSNRMHRRVQRALSGHHVYNIM